MAILREFARPLTIAEAEHLLHARGSSAALLSGGTGLVADLERRLRPEIDTVIDISHLGLCYLRAGADMLHLGAGATLTDVLENPVAAALADGLLARAVRGEGPVNLRNAATVGGIVATAEHDSEFYAALLALDASVVTTDREQPVRLSALTPARRIVLEVQIATRERPMRGGHARLSRTPADRPIVAALAVREPEGIRVALCGVADHPVLVGQEYAPYADFAGSVEYRRAMAEVLVARAVNQLGA